MALRGFGKKIEQAPEIRTAEAPRPPANHDESNWLVSYADMMTLLCGFFIMLFSMAKLDDPSFEKVKQEVSKTFGGAYISPNQDIVDFVTQVLDQTGLTKETVMKSDPYGISLVFHSTLFFDTLGTDVKSEGRGILEKLIDAIRKQQKKNGKEYRIVVEGHTDSRPILGGVYPSNWELSGARASAVVRMFLDKGFDPAKCTAIGYADTHPTVPERSPAGVWDDQALAKNRRVVLRILDPRVLMIPAPDREVGSPQQSTEFQSSAVTTPPVPPAPVSAPVTSTH